MTTGFFEDLMSDLKEQSDPEQAKNQARYLKTSKLFFLGLKLPVIHKTAKKYMKGVPNEDLVAPMKKLWKQPFFETRIAAIDIMTRYVSEGDAEVSLQIISGWIDDIDTWALMDPLGGRCLGILLLREQLLEGELIKWRSSQNFWRRRASVLPYLYLSAKTVYKKDYLKRILDAVEPHISDQEFFVGKAAAWVLRELSKREPEIVRSFIDEHRDKMTPLVIREASKKL
ncbi:MAG: DNA alkylation repair protein [Candidatus Thorarchaeota archaeon]|jgi:3-methyladenine DNA glycosylase AlkD